MDKNSRRRTPLIGVTTSDNKHRFLYYLIKFAIFLAGGKAKKISPKNGYIDLNQFDGFVISGGSDISPKLYGENVFDEKNEYDVKRDKLEQKVILHLLANKKPALGICRGMQMINVTLGGSLFQEISEVLEGFLPTRSMLAKFIVRRKVKIYKNSKLFDVLGKYECYRVNSIHHQAVNQLGDNLRIVAKEKNNLIQAIEMNGSKHPFLIAVQWHPELMLHVNSARSLFKSLVNFSSV